MSCCWSAQAADGRDDLARGGTDHVGGLRHRDHAREMGAGFLAGLADRILFERAIERDIRHSNENLKALVEAGVLVKTG